jgi:CopG family nickel-responsive transcriptional regulator
LAALDQKEECYYLKRKYYRTPFGFLEVKRMADLIRYGVSIDHSLSRRFDRLIKARGYASRSEAIRDLIRDRLVEEEWQAEDKVTVGVVTLLYNHHQRELSSKLTRSQHDHHAETISSLHVHLDDENCLEVVVMRARASTIRRAAERLIGTRGVKHGKLIMTSTGRQLT